MQGWSVLPKAQRVIDFEGEMFHIQSGKIEVLASINGVLGALVGITAGCCVVSVWEALLIGAVGSFLANITDPLLVHWKVQK